MSTPIANALSLICGAKNAANLAVEHISKCDPRVGASLTVLVMMLESAARHLKYSPVDSDLIDQAEDASANDTALARAFDMEEPIYHIENLIQALHMLSEAEHNSGHSMTAQAMRGIAQSMEETWGNLHDRWKGLFEKLTREQESPGTIRHAETGDRAAAFGSLAAEASPA